MGPQRNNQAIEPCQDYCSKCSTSNSLRFHENLSLSYNEQSVHNNEKKIKLTNRAFRVLCALLKYKNHPVSFSFLQDYGWPDNSVVRNNLTVIISEIRIYIRATEIKIANVRGFGYILTTSIDEVKVYHDNKCVVYIT
jgi:DNA-binding winged helix-turn-helix (wHTH) protein